MTITQKDIVFVKLAKNFIKACNFIKDKVYDKCPLHEIPEDILAADFYTDLPRLELIDMGD